MVVVWVELLRQTELLRQDLVSETEAFRVFPQSVWRQTTDRSFRVRSPVGVRDFSLSHNLPDRSWGLPSVLCVMFLEEIGPGRGVDHPAHISAEVKERVELYLFLCSHGML